MIEDRKVKVTKRGKVVYTYDPYKKKRKATDILKKVAAVGIVTGSLVMLSCGLGGALKFEQIEGDIRQIAVENGFEERVDNDFINTPEKMEELDKYMANSPYVTEEEYNAFLKSKKEAEDTKVFSLATAFSGAGLAIAGLGTKIGVNVAEEKRYRADRRKRQDVTKSFDKPYHEDWTSAEIDIHFDNYDSYSVVEREQRKK